MHPSLAPSARAQVHTHVRTSGRTRARAVVGVLALVASLLTLGLATAPAAHADGPGSGSPWVVSLGDSYISGEAGRWAGSSNSSSSYADALGSTAYFDNAGGTAETINRCHRSKTAEAYVGGGVNGLNLACSGARTATYTDGSGSFKPGLDFYSSGGQQGQALMLQGFAATHNVKMVAVSIGGNDFNFADIVATCVADFLYSPSWWKDYCNDDSSVTANFTSSNVATVKTRIATALQNVRTAMRNAGYSDASWTMLVQTYPSPIPNASGFRYSQSGYTRQNTGGCGFWNNDADWANSSALPTINNTVTGAITQAGISNAKVLNLSSALNGRRLCETRCRPVRGGRADLVDPVDRGQQDRVGQPDPHGVDVLLQQPLLHPGVAAPELLGAAGLPQLCAPGLQRRLTARWHLHADRERVGQR